MELHGSKEDILRTRLDGKEREQFESIVEEKRGLFRLFSCPVYISSFEKIMRFLKENLDYVILSSMHFMN